MSDRYFLDTNIFVCCFDGSAPHKKRIADQLVSEALKDHQGAISYQVVQEFLNVATRKFPQPMSLVDATNYLAGILAPLCEVFPSRTLYEEALRVQFRARISFYDALVVAGALQAGCKVLYSEDLHPGQRFDELAIQNPFST